MRKPTTIFQIDDDALTKLPPWGPPFWKISVWHAPRIPRYSAKFCGSCWPNGHLRGISRIFTRNIMPERSPSLAKLPQRPSTHWLVRLLAHQIGTSAPSALLGTTLSGDNPGRDKISLNKYTEHVTQCLSNFSCDCDCQNLLPFASQEGHRRRSHSRMSRTYKSHF